MLQARFAVEYCHLRVCGNVASERVLRRKPLCPDGRQDLDTPDVALGIHASSSSLWHRILYQFYRHLLSRFSRYSFRNHGELSHFHNKQLDRMIRGKPKVMLLLCSCDGVLSSEGYCVLCLMSM
jgi:hypothetical protein